MDLEIISTIAQALGAVASVAIAVLVFSLSKKIAQSEAVRSLSEGWAEYNSAMLSENNIELLNQFLERKIQTADEVPSGESKINFLLYLLLNCLNNTFHCVQAGIVEKSFADDIFGDYVALLGSRKEYVINLLGCRGYDAPFKAFFVKRLRATI